MTARLGLLLKRGDHVFLKLLTSAAFKYLNTPAFSSSFIINIDSGVSVYCCQGRNARGIGPSASQNIYLLYFKM